jgi:DNA-binding response OmpR family regulator
MQARILWIEGNRVEGPSFIPTLRKKGYVVEVVSTGGEALDVISKGDPDLIVLHAASMRSSGKRIYRSLYEKSNGTPIIVIARPNRPASEITFANTVLILPFTPRKLLNRIVPLLPSESGNQLHVGPIRLDLESKQLRCQGRETKLTPRLVFLLKILMKHPGEVMERERLFREVWSTEYTEDTRTLDVHISWLRRALEEDPRHPKFLKTIRGVGYRLDIEPIPGSPARMSPGRP